MYANRYRSTILENVLRVIHVYERNPPNGEQKRYALCERFATYTEYIFIIGMILYGFSIVFYFSYPIVMYFGYNQYELMLPVLVPGVDRTTLKGYVVLAIVHIVFLVFAFLGSTSSDFTFTMIITNAPVFAHILDINIQELNELLRGNEKHLGQIREKFRNVLIIHQETIE